MGCAAAAAQVGGERDGCPRDRGRHARREETAGARRRRARQPDPVWGPLLKGLRVLEREYPLAFTQACRSVGFYLVGLDTRLQRELLRLKPDPGTIAVERR
jgi:hypothetical protein